MTDDLKTLPGWDELTAAGRVAPPSPEVLARSRSAVRVARPRRWLVPVLAVVATAAVIAAGAVVLRPDPAPPVASEPVYLQGGPDDAICAGRYSPERLKQLPFAFDGTVTEVEVRPVAPGPVKISRAARVQVTFQVTEWFKGDDGSPIQVSMAVLGEVPRPGGNPYGLPFKVGSRLLIAGDTTSGGSIQLSRAWMCGFSRFYDDASAREWRAAFGK